MRLTSNYTLVTLSRPRLRQAKEKARNNPWAICNTLPEGTSDDKYERCVRKVKKTLK